MKKILLLLLLIFFNNLRVHSQTKILISYDAAGNQIKRMICIDCASGTGKKSIPKTAETLVEDDLIKEDLNKNISYYPNPVLEQLYVKWDNTNDNYVVSIQIYSMAGQLLNKNDNLSGINFTTIAFQNYPQGFYNLILVYSTGKKETLKIVKKSN